MLEIGSGLGFFLRGVADNCDWNVEGIDVSEGAGRFARERLDLQVTEAPFEHIALPGDAFDLVRAKDVLEHVPQPMPFLGKIHRILRSGGLLELWLPNGPLDLDAARRCFRGGGREVMGAGHVLFISPKVLRAMLGAAGFGVVSASVFSFRYALKALGVLPMSSPQEATRTEAARPGPSLMEWERPGPERGIKGTMLYARLRDWRSCHPALPFWLPFAFRQRVIARKL
jgi:SAM-dependent methyltransferase